MSSSSHFDFIFLLSINALNRIHKDKYKDDDAVDATERFGRPNRKDTSDSGSKKRDKSRTRNFFARKKSTAS